MQWIWAIIALIIALAPPTPVYGHTAREHKSHKPTPTPTPVVYPITVFPHPTPTIPYCTAVVGSFPGDTNCPVPQK